MKDIREGSFVSWIGASTTENIPRVAGSPPPSTLGVAMTLLSGYPSTEREPPADAEAISHKLMWCVPA